MQKVKNSRGKSKICYILGETFSTELHFRPPHLVCFWLSKNGQLKARLLVYVTIDHLSYQRLLWIYPNFLFIWLALAAAVGKIARRKKPFGPLFWAKPSCSISSSRFTEEITSRVLHYTPWEGSKKYTTVSHLIDLFSARERVRKYWKINMRFNGPSGIHSCCKAKVPGQKNEGQQKKAMKVKTFYTPLAPLIF